MKLPAALTLPTGLTVRLRARGAPAAPRRRADGAPLFSEVLATFDDGEVVLEGADVRDLALPDFHVLRAVLTKRGFVAEDEIEIACANCGAPIRLRPCETLEIGPWIDGELGDPELDALDEPGTPHAIPGLGEVAIARRTVRQAEPLFLALGKKAFVVTPEVARAMGVEGPSAAELAECDDETFDAVADLFLRATYPLRLGAIVFCPACKARNDVDAPYERELSPSAPGGAGSGASALPELDAFAERARRIAEPLLATIPGEPVSLVVDDGTPAVDDGGEPLLGSYVPPFPGDLGAPSHPPTVTVYYRTFRAIADEEGPFDWEDELAETIEHELEHHVYFLRGDDPMDAAEREEINREALRVVGRRETTRRTVRSFGESLADFAKRTWPLWLIALAALLLGLAASR